MKKTKSLPEQPFVTLQDVVHVLILIGIALLFSLMPSRSFGQPMPGHIAEDAFSALELAPPPTVEPPTVESGEPNQAPASFLPLIPDVPEPAAAPINPMVEQYYAPARQEAPAPVEAVADSMTATQYSPYSPARPQDNQPAQPRQRLPRRELTQRDALVSAEHPFRDYWGMPNDPETRIAGKMMSVAELFAGTRSTSVRRPLLQAYWELSGLLAVYHFRCETERLAIAAARTQKDEIHEGMMALLREQRRAAEMEFIKQQWVLAELLRQSKGVMLRESELPIPIDYPLYPRYQTFADQIARSERTRYLGRMIPVQEQLIESKYGTWKAASEMQPSAAQPFFAVSTQRTSAFLDLTKAMIEYNKMIAEYALETIPPNVSQRVLVGAVVRQSGGLTLTQYDVPASVQAQPIELVAHEYEYRIPDRQAPTSCVLDSCVSGN